jgi:integrase
MLMAGSGTMNERQRGVWTLRVELPSRGGQRRWKSETFRGTKTDARKRLAVLVKDVDEKYRSPRQGSEWTFRELFDEWVVGLSLTTDNPRSATTIYQERKRFERHIAPVFGDRLVESIERKEIKDFYLRLRRPHRVSGEKENRRALSSTSVARIHEQMRAMCAWAADNDLISYNPLRDIKRPRIVLTPPQSPDPQDVDFLLQQLWKSNRKLWMAVRIAATTGARRSELVALRWRDIAFTGKGAPAIHIDRGLTYVPGAGLVQTDTKTGVSAAARISIDDELARVLRDGWVDFIELNGARANGFIFSSDPQGQIPWHPDTLTTGLRKVVDTYGKVSKRRRVTLKSLRAYVASELEAQGNDAATAQAVLRHKSPLTTQRHYAAARERKMRSATANLGRGFTERGILNPRQE